MINFEVPELDQREPSVNCLSADLQAALKASISRDELPLLRRLTTSMMGQIVNVWYELHIFVKHDAWNEFGAGNYVKIPVIIIPQPFR